MFSISRSVITSVVKRQQISARFASSLSDSVSTLKGEHFISIDQLRWVRVESFIFFWVWYILFIFNEMKWNARHLPTKYIIIIIIYYLSHFFLPARLLSIESKCLFFFFFCVWRNKTNWLQSIHTIFYERRQQLIN